MEFTWQDNKRRINQQKHDFDFADASLVFAGPTLTREDQRLAYDEPRYNTTGLLGSRVVVICHTETENSIHIISMRKAERHEIEDFFSYL